MDEWTRQAQLERHLHLPASVTPSNNDPMVEANSQVFFISTFTYPLFALVASAIPRELIPAITLVFRGFDFRVELTRFATHCQDNLEIWQRRITQLANRNALKRQPNKLTLTPTTTTSDFLTVFPLTLPRLFLSEEQRSENGFDSRPGSSLSSAAPFDPMTSPGVSPPSPTDPSPANLAPIRPDTAMSNGNLSTRSTATNTSESSTAIRAAYKASVRKKKSFHRSSWTQGSVSTRENFPIGAHQLKYSTTADLPTISSLPPTSKLPGETNGVHGLSRLNPALQIVPPTSGS